MRLLFKLLRKNVSVWQLIGFALANIVGAVIVLLGVQFYCDVIKVLESSQGLFGGDFVVLSKPVSSASTLAGVLGHSPKSFKKDEIEELQHIAGVSRVEKFRTSSFPVYGVVSLGEFEVSTEMFLESVPNDFMDIEQDEWTASTENRTIPLVVPRAYLNFYNYGFAASRGMPQIGESLFSAVPIKLIARGTTEQVTYEGKIVGFTDNLNTILVPDDFLEKANQHFAHTENTRITRIIVEPDGTSLDDLMEYIAEKDYVIDGNGDNSVRLLSIVKAITSAVILIGLIVALLAFFLLLISILLMVEKNRSKNENLFQLGYPETLIARPYQILATIIDVVVWAVAITITHIIYPFILSLIQAAYQNFYPYSFKGIYVIPSLLCTFFVLVHIRLIRRKIC